MFLKKSIIYTIAACAVICAVAVFYSLEKTNFSSAQNYTPNLTQKTIEKNDNTAPSKEDIHNQSVNISENYGNEALDSEKNVLYVVKNVQGKLGIYLPNAPIPQEILDVYVSHLPPADQDMFEEGVLIYSEAQLTSLLEDFGS